MPYASESFTGVAAQATYVFGAGLDSLTGGLRFLSSEHLAVFVNGVSQTFTVAANRLSFTITGVPIVGGETILVRRQTPATEEGRRVNFEDLSHVRQADLDLSSLQLLYIAQEGLDVISAATCLELGVSGHWDAELLKIENLAAGVAAADAVNKGQLDAVAVANGNLPVVTSADNDKGLAVVAGAWAVRTPAQMRVHFGLGTAAVLNVGTGANQVVQFDGSARYPANDGRNIDLTNNAVMTALNLRYRTTVGGVRQGTEATPATNATATWSQTAGSRLTPGTLTDLDNAGDIVVDNIGKKVTLGIGTWEIVYTVRAYNQNTTAGNDQDLRVKITNDDDTGSQIVYDTEYDRIDIESSGSGNKTLWTLSNTLLLKFPAGGTIVLRAVNEDGADIRIPSTQLTFRKVSLTAV